MNQLSNAQYKQNFNSSTFSKGTVLGSIYTNSFTFTHELSGLKDERMNSVKNGVRFFRDITTDAFTKTFLADDTIRYCFINYTYHMINTNIQTKINTYLIQNNQKPIYGDEYIKFLFKGGNIMNFFVNAYLKNNGSNNTNIIDKEYLSAHYNVNKDNITDKYKDDQKKEDNCKEFIEFIKSKFKISDIDYTVIIKGANYARYTLIHGGVTNILADTLTTIGKFFDDYYINYETMKINATTPPRKIAQRDTATSDYIRSYVNKRLVIMKKIISNPYLDVIIKKVVADRNDPDLNDDTWLKKHLTVRNYIEVVKWLVDFDPLTMITPLIQDNIINMLSLFSLHNIYEYLQIISYLHTKGLMTGMNKSLYGQYITKVGSYIDISLDEKMRLVIMSDFYTKEKLDDFKKMIAKQLNDEFKKNNEITKYDHNFTGLVLVDDVIKMKQPIEEADINIVQRGGTVVHSFNDPRKQIRIKDATDKKYHYITYNNIIHTRFMHSHAFDLMRIKLNVSCSNTARFTKNDKNQILNIPSEFVDVSIPRWKDKGLQMSLDHPNLFELNYTDTGKKINVSVLSYDMDEICLDLQHVLFDQNIFCPWIDLKYTKRIIRYVFMLALCADDKLKRDNAVRNVEIEKFRGVITLTDNFLTYMSDAVTADKYPYDKLAKFLDIDGNNVQHEINNIAHKYKHLYMSNILCVKDEYKLYSNLIKFLAMSAYICKCNSNICADFINTNRKNFGYVPYDGGSDTIKTKYVKNFKDMMQTIVDVGIRSDYIINSSCVQQPITRVSIHTGGFKKINFYEDMYITHKINYKKLLQLYELK
jgi:hypothetical protein